MSEAENHPPASSVTALRIPIIKKGEYDLWCMKMRQYIAITDHILWDIITNVRTDPQIYLGLDPSLVMVDPCDAAITYFESPNNEEAKKIIKAHIVELRRNIQVKKMVQKGKNIVKEKSKGKNVIQQEDEDNKYPWVVYIHYVSDIQKWVVRTFKDEQKCLLSRKIKACTSSFMSSHLVDLIQMNPEIPTKVIQDQMQKQFHVGVSIHKAFRAKVKAVSALKGVAQVQYSLQDALVARCTYGIHNQFAVLTYV
ncbi:hypothetical protein Tco_0715043 [Tanacetum coccineum]